MRTATINPVIRFISGSCKNAMMTLFILINCVYLCGGYNRYLILIDARVIDTDTCNRFGNYTIIPLQHIM